MKKQVKAHMLPTDRATSLWNCGSDLCYDDKATLKSVDSIWVPQHIYITSDEKIKEGDHILSKYSIGALYIDGKLNTVKMLAEGKWRKIIATSDRSLKIKIPLENRTGLHVTKKLPNVSQSFIKEFVESGGKEDWEVEYHFEGEFCGLCGFTRESKQCINRSECDNKWSGGELKPKLDSDNCVILSAVETCEHPFKRLHWVGTKVYCNKCNTTLTKPVEEKMYSREEVNRLIIKAFEEVKHEIIKL
jgi:hypothetical protein